jgi:murE/murF fusion protein
MRRWRLHRAASQRRRPGCEPDGRLVKADTTARDMLAQLAALGVLPSGASDDSRQISAGDLFLAYPGDLADGRKHIAAAIAAGALCGPLAQAVYGRPSERLSLIAVTGTNGKTTSRSGLPLPSAPLRDHRHAGRRFPRHLLDTGFTTPEATTLARSLADFADAGGTGLRARSQFDRHCRRSPRRCARRRRRLHQSDARSSRLPRFDGELRQAKKRLFAWPRLRLAVSIWTIRSASSWRNDHGHQSGWLHARRRFCRPAGWIRAEDVEEGVTGLRFRLSAPNGGRWSKPAWSGATTSPICSPWPPS